jgi:hypothetical protein
VDLHLPSMLPALAARRFRMYREFRARQLGQDKMSTYRPFQRRVSGVN